MLLGYFDESGQQSDGWVCLAGFVGSEEQWRVFDVRWREALGRRSRLHMHDLRWAHPRTRRVLQELGPVPHSCGLEPARGVVRVSDYADLVVGSRHAILYSGYVACLTSLITQILRGMPPGERLAVTFERQDRYAPHARQMLGCYAPPLAGWQFVQKGACSRLEPADFLAFAVRELHVAPGSRKAKWCSPILGPGGVSQLAYGVTLSRDQVRRIVMRALAMNRTQGLD